MGASQQTGAALGLGGRGSQGITTCISIDGSQWRKSLQIHKRTDPWKARNGWRVGLTCSTLFFVSLLASLSLWRCLRSKNGRPGWGGSQMEITLMLCGGLRFLSAIQTEVLENAGAVRSGHLSSHSLHLRSFALCTVILCCGTIRSKHCVIDLKGVIFQMTEVWKHIFLIS